MPGSWTGWIARAQNGTPEGLRALGVTAQLDLERFRRLAIVAPGAMPPLPGMAGHHLPDLSPPLVSYLEALLLFADAFRPAGGLRLLRIARPAILFYGLYNPNLLEHDRKLLELIMIRGNLATLLDTLFPSGGVRGVVPQVLLDMLLTSLDRAIDLLSLGAEPGIQRGDRDPCRHLLVKDRGVDPADPEGNQLRPTADNWDFPGGSPGRCAGHGWRSTASTAAAGRNWS